jgi:hypothetical protein
MEEEFSTCVEVFDNLVSVDAPILSKHVSQLIEFFLQIGRHQGYSHEIRNHALSFLMWIIV